MDLIYRLLIFWVHWGIKKITTTKNETKHEIKVTVGYILTSFFKLWVRCKPI